MSKVCEMLLFILFKILYDYIYIHFTTREFSYMQSILQFDFYRYLINWIIFFILLSIIILFMKNNIMSYVMKTIFLFSTIPTISLYGLKSMTNEAYILMILYWIIMILSFAVLQNVKINSTTNESYQYRNDKGSLSNVVFIFAAILTFYFWARYGQFRILTSFSNVYYYRLEHRQANMISIFRYLMLWLGNVFLPYCFASFLINRKYIKVLFAFICGLMLFSINGLKSWLVIYALILFIFIVHRNKCKYNRYTGMLTFGVVMYGIMSMVHYNISGSTVLGAMFHRVFSVPAELNFNYFTFFRENEPLLLRESFLRIFWDSPYDTLSSYIIGGLFGKGDFETNANNGMFGDAYANFKIFGVIIYPIILSLTFKLIEHFSRNQDIRLVMCVLLILIWNLINASFFTWLLSGGVIIFILIFHFDGKINTDLSIK